MCSSFPDLTCSIHSGDEMYDAEGKGDKFMPFHRAGYDSKTGQVTNTTRVDFLSQTEMSSQLFLYNIVFEIMGKFHYHDQNIPTLTSRHIVTCFMFCFWDFWICL